MEAIDAGKMNTDVQYRYNFLAKFLHFTKDDISVLNKVAPALVPLVPTVVDAIYKNLFSFDATKTVFATHKVHFQGNATATPGGLDLTPERVTFLSDMLATYLKKVLTQTEWDKGFLEYLSNLGKVHANKAESKNIDVNYVYMNATLGYAQNLIVNALLSNDLGLDDNTKKAAVLALNKFLCIQNDFFTMHYIPH
ncbi:unnamed protein product [Rotaria sp. Silwood2]|nr:unnamed protein product [Rotaria sp. Silwood2]CAF2641645.1 unnamed protein product [Rotaria sp. Silwood2]CAF2965745.1 unnamed protein product [Rotaria sp. Silwood2]CAF3126373.1 unnamed protein product [Rotaria sp. Silwood2]CAF4049001.1 unnamed protein product [Rotaria sp. Silwood2]